MPFEMLLVVVESDGKRIKIDDIKRSYADATYAFNEWGHSRSELMQIMTEQMWGSKLSIVDICGVKTLTHAHHMHTRTGHCSNGLHDDSDFSG